MSARKAPRKSEPFFRYRKDDSTVGTVVDGFVLPRHSDPVPAHYSWSKTDRPNGSIRKIWDTVTPGYKSIVARGGIVNTGYQSEKITFHPSFGTINQLCIGDCTDGMYTGDLLAWFHTMPTRSQVQYMPDARINALIARAVLNARMNVSKPDTLSLVTMYEMEKTISMVENSATKLAEAMRLLKCGKSTYDSLRRLGRRTNRAKKVICSPSKTLGDNWLELRYGWLPTILDLQGTFKAFTKPYQKRFTARGFAVDSDHSTVNSTLGTLQTWNQPWNITEDTISSVKIRAYVLYTLEETAFRAQALGFASIPETLWEVVPFSFVVDWFVNIGDWLAAVTPRIGVNILAEGYTMQLTYDNIWQVVGETRNSSYNVSGVLGLVDHVNGTLRVRHAGLPNLSFPPVNVRINAQRAIDAIALLRQQFRRLF